MINLYPFIIYIMVTTFTPGPNNILSMSNALHFGYLKTVRFLAGICCGFFIIMLVCGLSNVALGAIIPSVERWSSVLAAIYMVYLAVHILRSKPVEDEVDSSNLNTFRAGFIMQFLNIKVILYGITVFSMFIIPVYHDYKSIILFAFLLTSMGYIATSCWAIGGNVFRKFLQGNYRIFNIVMAVLLLYTAAAGLPGH